MTLSAKEKSNRYSTVVKELTAILDPSHYAMTDIGKMATISSVLHMHFPEWVFVGYYRQVAERKLEIGPYQGAILACGTIDFGRGVCGVAAETGRTQIVEDVTQFPDYIACDDQTQSEIVVPVISENRAIAVLDIDGADIGTFDSTDAKFLEQIAPMII